MSEATRRRTVLPAAIPIFPLAGALLLPRGQLPLNFFEPRYLNMVDDALRGDRMIGMVQSRSRPGPNGEDIYAVGCAGRIASFAETDDGRYLVTLLGVSRFRILEELESDAPYRSARMDWTAFDDSEPRPDDMFLVRKPLMDLLGRYLEAEGLSADWGSIDKAGHETLVNSLSMICPFSADEKQALLEARTLEERTAALSALMEMAISANGDGGPAN